MENLQELWIFYFIVKVMIDISVKDVQKLAAFKTFILRRFLKSLLFGENGGMGNGIS